MVTTKDLAMTLIQTWRIEKISRREKGDSYLLAEKIGITRSTLSRIETGVTTIKSDNLQKLFQEVERTAGSQRVFKIFSDWIS